jgi:hypothetical protein
MRWVPDGLWGVMTVDFRNGIADGSYARTEWEGWAAYQVVAGLHREMSWLRRRTAVSPPHPLKVPAQGKLVLDRCLLMLGQYLLMLDRCLLMLSQYLLMLDRCLLVLSRCLLMLNQELYPGLPGQDRSAVGVDRSMTVIHRTLKTIEPSHSDLVFERWGNCLMDRSWSVDEEG